MINIPYPSEITLDKFFQMRKGAILYRIKVIKQAKSVSIKGKKYRISPYIRKVLTRLQDEEKLREVLLAKPEKLVQIIEEFEEKYRKVRYTKEYINKVLYRIFVDYGYDEINKLDFIDNIKLGSCPYCNRNYIYTTSKKGTVKPEIDHFYPKSLYPYLACSYFNLIPSCPTCNGFGAKEAKDTLRDYPISNPYTIKEIDFQFTITPEDIDFINVESEHYNYDNFEIELYGNKANLDVFHLEELYSQHKDIVLELLVKRAYYPRSYIRDLANYGFSPDEIYRYLFSNYNKYEDLHKRPMSKLVRDIATELEFMKEFNGQ